MKFPEFIYIDEKKVNNIHSFEKRNVMNELHATDLQNCIRETASVLKVNIVELAAMVFPCVRNRNNLEKGIVVDLTNWNHDSDFNTMILPFDVKNEMKTEFKTEMKQEFKNDYIKGENEFNSSSSVKIENNNMDVEEASKEEVITYIQTAMFHEETGFFVRMKKNVQTTSLLQENVWRNCCKQLFQRKFFDEDKQTELKKFILQNKNFLSKETAACCLIFVFREINGGAALTQSIKKQVFGVEEGVYKKNYDVLKSFLTEEQKPLLYTTKLKKS